MKEEIESWINDFNKIEAIPADIVALNIGVYETMDGYCLYITGSRYYDEENDDWACDAAYKPDYRFLVIPNKINSDWMLFLKEVKMILFDYFHSKEANISQMSGRYITIGFDDGDLEVIHRPNDNW